MLARKAASQASSPQSRKSPGGGPALFTRMSGSEQAASRAARPSSVATSAATVATSTPCLARISAAAEAERVSTARVDHQRHAVLGQGLGTGTAEPLPARDDCRRPRMPSIRSLLRWRSAQARRGRAGERHGDRSAGLQSPVESADDRACCGKRPLDAPGQERHDVMVGPDLAVGQLCCVKTRPARRRVP